MISRFSFVIVVTFNCCWLCKLIKKVHIYILLVVVVVVPFFRFSFDRSAVRIRSLSNQPYYFYIKIIIIIKLLRRRSGIKKGIVINAVGRHYLQTSKKDLGPECQFIQSRSIIHL